MYRKRRSPRREIAFSFDSFLILVAWVGARAYQAALEKAAQKEPAQTAAEGKPLPADPLQRELDKARQELEQARAEMLEKLKALDSVEEEKNKVRRELVQVSLA